MPLEGRSSQVFEFKGLAGKVFRNKDLEDASLRSGFRQRTDAQLIASWVVKPSCPIDI